MNFTNIGLLINSKYNTAAEEKSVPIEKVITSGRTNKL